MTPQFDNQEYYRKMLELQEKLRKSEEERIRLEERFNLLERESRIRHDACINKLRMKYIEFLEEQRLRDERNSKLLGALDRVDSSLASMSAKTDKLYALRKEYKASYVSRRQSPSVTGDSGIVLGFRDPQRLTINYQPRFPLKSRHLEPTWGLESSCLNAPCSSEHVESFRRSPRYLPKEYSPFQYPETIKPIKTTKLTSMLSTSHFDDEKKDDIVENKLEEYMTKIRSLHGNLDHSLEEVDHEQNTSGDLLNVTLSDDGLDHLPTEEKIKDIPEEIGKVLAIAEDLASRTMQNTTSSTCSDKYLNVSLLSKHFNVSAINDKHSATQQSDEMRPIARDLEIDRPQNAENQKISHSTESPLPIEINPKVLDPSAENALKLIDQVDKVLINQEESNNVSQIYELSENNNINEDKDKLDADEVTQQHVNLVNDEEDKPQNVENYQNENQGDVEQYQETDYQEQAVSYDYSHQDDGYQYADGQYHYNHQDYDPNNQVIEGTYPGEGSEHYQSENYDSNYPEVSNIQYTSENYLQDPNSPYQGNNYDPNDPDAQHQEENYPQENQYQYENSNQQYEGVNYPSNDANEGYDQTDIPGDQQLEPSVGGSSIREKDNMNEESKKKKDVIKSILESETESISIEKNTSNTESDFDFN